MSSNVLTSPWESGTIIRNNNNGNLQDVATDPLPSQGRQHNKTARQIRPQQTTDQHQNV